MISFRVPAGLFSEKACLEFMWTDVGVQPNKAQSKTVKKVDKPKERS